jgi:hypothetical protein
MSTPEGRKLGGLTSGRRLRRAALEDYYNNPNHCLQCGKIIEVAEGQKVHTTRQKKFCNSSCAAKHTNKQRDRRPWGKSKGKCKKCGQEFNYRRLVGGGYESKVKYCKDCIPVVRRENGKVHGIKNLGDSLTALPKPVEEMTKGELKDCIGGYRFWQPYIGKHSRKIYEDSGRPYICQCCGYTRHVEICHIRDVNNFPDTALVSEINDIENLSALCRNCHWVFDHGTEEEKREILNSIQTQIAALKIKGFTQTADEALQLLQELKSKT